MPTKSEENYALTRIQHGKEDGEVVVFEEGEKVDESAFTDDQFKALKESGAVGPKPVTPEEAAKDRQALLDEIAALKEQLGKKEEANAPSNPQGVSSTTSSSRNSAPSNQGKDGK